MDTRHLSSVRPDAHTKFRHCTHLHSPVIRPLSNPPRVPNIYPTTGRRLHPNCTQWTQGPTRVLGHDRLLRGHERPNAPRWRDHPAVLFSTVLFTRSGIHPFSHFIIFGYSNINTELNSHKFATRNVHRGCSRHAVTRSHTTHRRAASCVCATRRTSRRRTRRASNKAHIHHAHATHRTDAIDPPASRDAAEARAEVAVAKI